MALRENFCAKKFWDQAFRIGSSKKLSQEDAEDFASLWLETLWKYQHYIPERWIWSAWFKRHKKNEFKTVSLQRPLQNGDFTLEDTLEAPRQALEQKENLTMDQEFIDLIARAPSKNLIRKLRKTIPFRNEEFRDFINQLEPIPI